jgi:hypothetical protein
VTDIRAHNFAHPATCDVSLDSLTLPAPEAGDFVELILFFLQKLDLKNKRSAFVYLPIFIVTLPKLAVPY